MYEDGVPVEISDLFPQPALAGTDMNMPGFISYGLGRSDPNPDNTTISYWGSALIESVSPAGPSSMFEY